MSKYNVEYTDTFAGETNYAWVRRWMIDAKTEAGAIRKAKALAGLTGHPCRKESFGDMVSLVPAGCCTILFVSEGYIDRG